MNLKYADTRKYLLVSGRTCICWANTELEAAGALVRHSDILTDYFEYSKDDSFFVPYVSEWEASL